MTELINGESSNSEISGDPVLKANTNVAADSTIHLAAPYESSEALVLDWIEGQYGISAENRSKCSSDNVEPVEEQRTATQEEGKRKSHASKRKTKRPVVDASVAAFKQSQHMMRKEGRHICMKDVFRKTLLSPSSFHTPTANIGDDVLSISTSSPNATESLGSIWSPQLANDITSQFLSCVEANKKRRFEKIVSRETGNSQTSGLMSPLASFDNQEEEELIICSEDANMGPPTEKFLSPSGENPTPVSSSVENLEEDREEDEEVIERERAAALSRKHRIWELQQRCRRAGQDMDIVIAPGRGSRPSESTDKNTTPVVQTEFFSPISMRARSFNDVSISESRLSNDDISMIRRINSFDKVATQRVVVFTSRTE